MNEIQDVDTLHAFIVELTKFRNLVRCPICLDIIASPVQLGCSHTFCSECLETYVDENVPRNNACPLCRTVMSKRQCVKNDKIEHLSKFVSAIANKIKATFGCDFTELTSVKKINSILRKKPDADNPEQNSSSSGLIPATVFKNAVDETGVVDDTNAFDVLMQSSVQNSRFKNVKTYRARKTADKKTETETYDKLIDFEDDKTKTKILEWLNDNRNRFDRITQSQQDSFEQSDVSCEPDLVSVSQTDGKTADKKKNKIAISRKLGVRKARSLDVVIKTYSRRPRVQRHTFAGETPECERLSIEEIDSESDKKAHEKVINLLEEECLNNIDTEMSVNAIKKPKRRRRKISENKPRTGWSRMKETNKKIKEKDRKPVQLTCSIPSTAKSKRVETSSKKTVGERSSDRFYDLDHFESYTNVILKNNHEMPLNEQIKDPICGRNEEKADEKEAIDVDFICRTSQVTKPDKQMIASLFSSEPNFDADIDDIFAQPTQKLVVADVIERNDSIEDKLAAIFSSPKRSILDGDVNIIETTTDKNVLRSKMDLGCNILNDFDDFVVKYRKMTKSLDNSIFTHISTEMQAYVLKLKDVFVDLKRVQETTNKPDTVASKSQDLFLSKKTPDRFSTTTQTAILDFQSIAVQTSKSPGFRISSNEAFKTQVKRDVEAQTETMKCYNCVCGCTNKVNNSRSSQSKTPSDVIVTHTEIAKRLVEKYQFTQSLDDVNFDTQEAIHNSIRKRLPPVSHFINITDEIHVNEAMDVIEEKPRGNENERLSVVGAVESQKSCSSGVSRKLHFSELGKKYKRIRPPNDSDSDDEVPKKMRKSKNKFVRDDLSIRFESGRVSTAPICDQAKDDLFVLSDGSDNINYDEYLEQVMKKYDNEILGKVQERPEPEKKQSDSQNIIDKCEALIKNATANEIKIHENKISTSKETLTQVRSIDFNSPFEEPIPKKQHFSESIFPITGNAADDKSTEIDEFKKHMNDGFDAELERIGNTNAPVAKHTVIDAKNKVTILQNIVLGNASNVTSELQFNLDDELEKLECNKSAKRRRSEEMFSESEDIDIVETTPQKSNTRKFTSQNSEQAHEDVPFIPPPLEFRDEFQDDFDDIENDRNDLIDLDATFVPPRPKFDVTNDTVIEVDDVTQISLRNKNVDVRDEPELHVSLTISPIQPEKQILNPITYAHNSKFSPLDVVPKKSTVFVSTSTPKQKSILNYVTNSQRPSQRAMQVSSAKKPRIACTRLNKDQIIAITSLMNKKLATYSNCFDLSVTHMIVSVNEKNCLKDHTMKFVSAVAAGLWVLSFEWIQECLSQCRIVPEEPYEVIDVSGVPGPKLSRLTRLEKPLLKGYKIYAAPPFLSTTQTDIEAVVKMLGGQVVPSPECLLKKDATCLIVTEARSTQDFELCGTWLESLRVISVDIEWLSRSVGQFNLLSLRPFALCWDDDICTSSYSDQLLVNASFSFTQSNYST